MYRHVSTKRIFFTIISVVSVYSLFASVNLFDMNTFVRCSPESQPYTERINNAKKELIYSDRKNLYADGQYWKRDKPFTHQDPSGYEKFVIFDSIYFSGSLGFLNEIPKGWAVFVVNGNDESLSSDCSNCLSMSKSSKALDILEKIRTKSAGHLPLALMTKMAATLYASYRKSPWIYVTNKPIPVPFDKLGKLAQNQPEKGIVYNGPKEIFQPCRHFMDTFTWNGKGFLKDQNYYVHRTIPANPLYQFVDDCYRPDMNALTWQNLLDQRAPLPFVMPGIWAAVDFNNILVPLEASWTLVASMTGYPSNKESSPRSGHLSLLVQRLLWETQVVIGFVPGMPDSDTKKSCPTCRAEKALDKIGHGDMESLKTFACESQKDMVSCLRSVVDAGVLNMTSIKADQLKVLKSLMYTWASMLNEYEIKNSQRTPLGDAILDARKNGRYMYFTPSKSLQKEKVDGSTLPPNAFRDVCGQPGKPYSPVIPDHHPERFDGVLLVVSFNSNKYLNLINYIDFLFGRHFKQIFYCATGIEAFEKLYLRTLNSNPVTFADVDIGNGYFGHHCAVAAMEMNYNVSGYLYMSDDVMINVWNMYNHPFHMPWFQNDIRVVNLLSTFTRGHDYAKDWYPWNKPTGKPAITKVINTLKSLKNDSRVGPRVTWFLKNLAEMASCDNCIAYMDADLHYIPAYMASDFKFMVPYFKGVFQELSIPTIISGITPLSDRNVYRLRGYYLVGAFKRNNFDKSWSHEELFVHPVKLSALKTPKVTDFYCDVARRTDVDLARFPH